MLLLRLFDDQKRCRVRKKKDVSFFTDYMFHSEVTDYKCLRYVINSLLGLIFCACIYYLGWKNLNFGDFNPFYSLAIKWSVILFTAGTFSKSPTFRCALFLLLLGALGKNGQAPLTLLVGNSILDGPIHNIAENYKLTAEIIVCHLQVQAKIISNRVAMFTGPLEELLERQLNKGLRVLKQAVHVVRQLIAPFLAEIREEKTTEDVVMDNTEQQLQILSQRRALGAGALDESEEIGLTEEEMRNVTGNRPEWTRFKTGVGQRIVHRMQQRCKDIFSKGIGKCRELFASVQKKCYDSLPLLVNYVVCKKFSMESSCQDLSRRREQLSVCQSQATKLSGSQAMEGDLLEVSNMTKELGGELHVNLHMVAVEAPRVEMEYSLRDVLLLIRAGKEYVTSIISSVRQVFVAAMIFTVYKLFSQAVATIEKYNGNVDFNNCFVGRPFWLIDEHRHHAGKYALLRLEKSEWKKWRLKRVFSKPTRLELCATWRPFLIWLITAFFATTMVLVDWYIYLFLEKLVTASEKTIQMESKASAEIVVTGKGVVADFINNMIKVNRTTEQEDVVTNLHCLQHPHRPDGAQYVLWIGLPLLLQLLLQVFFSYFVKRIVINFLLPFMFPKRDRVRLIFLYNKVAFLRNKDRQEARARIRFCVQQRDIQREQDENDRAWPSSNSWLKLKVLDRIFMTGQCLLCQTYLRPAKLKCCADCPATFCSHCIEEMSGRCYACQAEKGEVTSARTQYLAPAPSSINGDKKRRAEDKFVSNKIKTEKK